MLGNHIYRAFSLATEIDVMDLFLTYSRFICFDDRTNNSDSQTSNDQIFQTSAQADRWTDNQSRHD